MVDIMTPISRRDDHDLLKIGRSAIGNKPKFAETALILLKHLRHIEFSAAGFKILQKCFVRRFFC